MAEMGKDHIGDTNELITAVLRTSGQAKVCNGRQGIDRDGIDGV